MKPSASADGKWFNPGTGCDSLRYVPIQELNPKEDIGLAERGVVLFHGNIKRALLDAYAEGRKDLQTEMRQMLGVK